MSLLQLQQTQCTLRNIERRSHLCLCGGKETQFVIGKKKKKIAAILTKNKVIAMCHSSKLEEVGVCVVNRYMNKLEQV